MMYYNDGFCPSMFGFGIFGLLIQIFFAILVISIIVSIIRRVRGHRHSKCCGWHGNDSVEIIRERYAKGEITKEQFESMKKDLEQ